MSSSGVSPTSSSVNQNEFLQLMVDQMKNQDPLQPMDNSQFLAQLAQFTSLEQMTNISQSNTSILQALTAMQSMAQLSFEHQLIGTNVSVTDSSGNTVSGTVSAVKFVSGSPQLVVNGQAYALSALTEMG